MRKQLTPGCSVQACTAPASSRSSARTRCCCCCHAQTTNAGLLGAGMHCTRELKIEREDALLLLPCVNNLTPGCSVQACTARASSRSSARTRCRCPRQASLSLLQQRVEANGGIQKRRLPSGAGTTSVYFARLV